jgi:FMN-dependent oxidoreductase (nitrilotriacetate monooxygenase family)
VSTDEKPRKQIHLAAHFPGVNNTTVWSDPRSGSHIAFDSFRRFAQTAERAKFDFLFLAEGLRLREQHGLIYDLDVVGRPDTFTVLAALAAVTDRLGLAGTINSTFNEPYEVARQFASLDHLSAGRAAWNVVTSWDAFTGENFRRGGYLPQDQRYQRARGFLHAAQQLFDAWRGDEIVGDKESGAFLSNPDPGTFEIHDAFFDIEGSFNVPRSPQGRPVIFQAGDSDEGREFAAAQADAIFSRHGTKDAGQAFYADVKQRMERYGRDRDQLKVLPAATFVLADTDAEAHELAAVVRRQQVSGQTAIRFLEQLWNRDLSGYDPDGPLPEIDPDLGEHTVARGRASVRMFRDPLETAKEWRELAKAKGYSIRDLIIEVTGRQNFIGSPATIAEAINDLVQSDAADGFILVPHITPDGLDAFADKVVPLLQEKGVFRSEYTGTTLREHLGLDGLVGLDEHAVQGRRGAGGKGGVAAGSVAEAAAQSGATAHSGATA